MHGFIANTDFEWLTAVRRTGPSIGEVVYWRAGTERFRALEPGEPFFFKLKAPLDGIAGFGFFSHFIVLPLSVAWKIGGSANGARDELEMRERLVSLRSRVGMKTPVHGDVPVGCILINHPTFFGEGDFVHVPSDFVAHVGQGKVYDLSRGGGRAIWTDCLARLDGREGDEIAHGGRAGRRSPALAFSRLGRLSFTTNVIEKYRSRCTVTDEPSLPALQVVRIRRFGDDRELDVDNGLLLRADLAGLFESGWVTVTPDYEFRVSESLLERERANGQVDWKDLHGTPIHVPRLRRDRPSREALWWHNEKRFVG